jgi:flavin reductase (DIM6/NTAB) family NADH-FMN oxidoreductase RutF
VTIHSSFPFPAEEDPVRRLRGRLGGTVSLWTSGTGAGRGERAGLTVTSLMVANGEPARVVGLVDPDSDLAATLASTGRVVVQLLSWRHRDLADAFAGTSPAPGGPFALAPFEPTDWGPRLADAGTWLGASVESATEVGWSLQVTAVVESLVLGDDDQPLVHHRGRYTTP